MPHRSDADTVARSTCAIDCPSCGRLRSSLRAMLVERTWHELTAVEIAGAAGMDQADFAEHYPSVLACGVAALEEAAADCHARCAAAFPAWRDCSERFFGMSDTVLSWIDAEPEMARLLFVVPEQVHHPVLLHRFGRFKGALSALFDQPGRCTPAGRTHVEFVIGVFCQAAYQHLDSEAEPGSLRRRVLALATFIGAPPR